METILILILIIIVLAALVLGLTMLIGSKPITKKGAINSINNMVKSQLNKKNVTQSIVYVDSRGYNITQTFAHGQLDSQPIAPDQPFHVASVGKAFTATLIGILADDGALDLDDSIADYLSSDMLDGLFVYDGIDYSRQVTIAQLLNHTSGVDDYFDGRTSGSKPMGKLVFENPDLLWTPRDLVDFTRSYQSAVAKPGEKHQYSDTGYILLGLIIERLSGMSFDKMLHEKIFIPLSMDDSYLMFYSQPKNQTRPIADVWLGDVNIKDYNSLSIDWAGGGIVSTAHDLGIFIRALNNGEIISDKTLKSLYRFDNKFRNGIHYGKGFMEFHFGEFFPTLNSMPNYVGHMGILGTQMLYDKSTDTVYIASLGSSNAVSRSVQLLINTVSSLERIEQKQ